MNDLVLSNFIPLRLSMIDPHLEHDHLGNLDSQEIAVIYNQYFPEIFRYARYRLDDDALAEDISSEVFFCLLKAAKTGHGPSVNLHGWLMGTARHLIIDHFRWKHRHPSETISDATEFDGGKPSDEAEQRDASHALHLALIQLTEDQQQVLALRFGQGYSLEETANEMKKNINAVKALQFRALKALQHKIGEEK